MNISTPCVPRLNRFAKSAKNEGHRSGYSSATAYAHACASLFFTNAGVDVDEAAVAAELRRSSPPSPPVAISPVASLTHAPSARRSVSASSSDIVVPPPLASFASASVSVCRHQNFVSLDVVREYARRHTAHARASRFSASSARDASAAFAVARASFVRANASRTTASSASTSSSVVIRSIARVARGARRRPVARRNRRASRRGRCFTHGPSIDPQTHVTHGYTQNDTALFAHTSRSRGFGRADNATPRRRRFATRGARAVRARATRRARRRARLDARTTRYYAIDAKIATIARERATDSTQDERRACGCVVPPTTTNGATARRPTARRPMAATTRRSMRD